MFARLDLRLAGIFCMIGGIFLFAVNDVVGKWLAGVYPAGQILAVRSVGALVVLAPFLWQAGLGAFRAARNPSLQVVRVAFSSLEVLLFYVAVSTEPLAVVMSVYLAGPAVVAALSPLIGERVPARRWILIGLGFLGALLVLRPSPTTLTVGSLAAVAGTVTFAALMLTTRALRGTHDAVLVGGQVVGALVLGLALLPFGVQPMPGSDTLAILGIGVVAMAAHVLVNRSLALAPASVVVPYQYTTLIWALLFGWLVFGETLHPLALGGAALVVLAGLLLFRDEQRAAAEEGAPPPHAVDRPGELA